MYNLNRDCSVVWTEGTCNDTQHKTTLTDLIVFKQLTYTEVAFLSRFDCGWNNSSGNAIFLFVCT